MMPWSGLLPLQIEHANEMGTSELHWTSIMLAATALTTDRSMHPGWSQKKAAVIAGRPRKNRCSKPHPSGRTRMHKTAWLGRHRYRSP